MRISVKRIESRVALLILICTACASPVLAQTPKTVVTEHGVFSGCLYVKLVEQPSFLASSVPREFKRGSDARLQKGFSVGDVDNIFRRLVPARGVPQATAPDLSFIWMPDGYERLCGTFGGLGET